MITRLGRLAGVSVFVFLFLAACQQPLGSGDNADNDGSSGDSTSGDESSGDDPQTPPAIASIVCEANPEFVTEVDGIYEVSVVYETPGLDNPLDCNFVLESITDNTVYCRLLYNADLPDWVTLVEDSARVELRTGEIQDETVQFGFYSSYNVDPDDDDSGGATKESPLTATFEIITAGDE